MSSDYAITTLERLREVIPEATQKTRSKIVARLGSLERRFIERSPMVFPDDAAREVDATIAKDARERL
jgi:hypothetical protein